MELDSHGVRIPLNNHRRIPLNNIPCVVEGFKRIHLGQENASDPKT